MSSSSSAVAITNRLGVLATYLGRNLGDNSRTISTLNCVCTLVHKGPSRYGSIPGNGDGIGILRLRASDRTAKRLYSRVDKEKKFQGVILPQENAREAAVVEGIDVIAVSSLTQAVAFLNEQLALEPYELDGRAYEASRLSASLDFVEVRGQEAVKRAITISCTGSHNILTIGTN